MKKNQLILLVVAVVIIGIIGIVTYKKRTSTWSEVGQISEKLFPNFPLDDIAKITIKNSKSELNLVKNNDVWQIKKAMIFPQISTRLASFCEKCGR